MNALLTKYKPMVVAVGLFLLVGGSFFFGKHVAQGEAADSAINAAHQYDAALTKAYAERDAARQKGAELLASADQAYQLKLAETQNAANTTINDLRTGRVRMLIPTCTESSGRAVPGSPATPGSSDGGSTSLVFERFYEDLVNRFSWADQVANQLGACQEVIAGYLQICGEKVK